MSRPSHRAPLLAVVVLALTGLTSGAPVHARAAQVQTRAQGDASLGSTQGPTGYLYRGCHVYDYAYDYHPPSGTGAWAAEVFITGPTGAAVASGAQLEGSDPLTGTDTFTLCVPSSVPGTYAIDVKLSRGQDGEPGQFVGYLPTSTFTLGLEPRTKHHHRAIYGIGPIRVR